MTRINFFLLNHYIFFYFCSIVLCWNFVAKVHNVNVFSKVWKGEYIKVETKSNSKVANTHKKVESKCVQIRGVDPLPQTVESLLRWSCSIQFV